MLDSLYSGIGRLLGIGDQWYSVEAWKWPSADTSRRDPDRRIIVRILVLQREKTFLRGRTF